MRKANCNRRHILLHQSIKRIPMWNTVHYTLIKPILILFLTTHRKHTACLIWLVSPYVVTCNALTAWRHCLLCFCVTQCGLWLNTQIISINIPSTFLTTSLPSSYRRRWPPVVQIKNYNAGLRRLKCLQAGTVKEQ
jgi:hypothetical protein